MLQAIYEAADSGNAGARIFFSQTSQKSFDLIDHNILMDELKQLEVCPALLSWIAGRSHIATDYFYFVTSNRTVT